jgi:uncharacterized protein involved in outer membrane biogenesis
MSRGRHRKDEVKKLLYGLIAVVVLVVAGVLVVPSFIDWNHYKPQIITQANKFTGRAVTIDGSIDLAMLPAPTLSVRGVRVANIEGATTGDMIRLKSLDVRIALLPLLSGEIQVEQITLVEPEIVLERLPDGRANWLFSDGALSEAGGAGSAGDLSELPLSITVDRLGIESGAIVYRDAGGRTERIDGIDMIISARTLTGPFTVQGALNARGTPLEIDGVIGEVKAQRSVVVKVNLATSGVTVTVSGKVLRDSPGFEGRFDLSAETPRALLAAVAALADTAVAPVIALDKAVSLKGRMRIDSEKVALSEVEFRLADTVATGVANLSLGKAPRFDVALTANRIDFDMLLAGLVAAARARDAGVAPADDTQGGDALAARELLIPANISGTIDLSVGAVLYRQQIVRQTVLSMSIFGGVVSLQRLSALLPGGSDVTVFGTIDSKRGAPRFVGQVEAASDNLRALFDWLAIDVATVPADRLRKFSLSASIDGTATQGSVTAIDLRLDTSRAVGGVAYALGNRPGFGVNLRLDRLNADAYLPRDRAAPDGEAAEAAEATATVFAPLAFLAGFDADFVTRIDNLTYRGIPFDGLVLNGLLQNGVLTLREARVANMAGARVDMTGTIAGLDGNPSVDGTVKFDTDSLATLARVVPLLDGLPPALTGAIGLNATLKGDTDSFVVDGELAALDGEFSLMGNFSNLSTDPTFDVALDLTNPDLAALLSALTDFDARDAAAAMSGPVVVAATAKGTLDGFDLDARVELADGTFSVVGRLDDVTGLPAFDLSAEASHPDLAALLRSTTGYQADVAAAALSGPVRATVKAVGVLSGFDLDASVVLADTTVNVTGRLEGLPDAPSYQLSAHLANPSMAALLRGFGAARMMDRMEGPVTISGRIDGSPTSISLPDLRAAMGRSSVVGSVAVTLDGPRPMVRADLTTGDLVVEYYLPAAPEPTHPASGGGGVEGGDAPGERWSREPINLSSLRAFDADLKVRADTLSYGGYLFEEAELALTVDDGVVVVHRLSARAFDGAIDLRARLDGREFPILEVSFDIKGADLHKALVQTAGVGAITGAMDMEARLEARGRSPYALISSLNGSGKIKNATDGAIDGIDLRALSERLDQLDNLGDFFDLAELSFDGGTTRYSELAGTIDVINGELHTNDLHLVADGGDGNVTGIVDLPNWSMDVTAMFRLSDHLDAPPLGVRLFGSIDTPERDVKTALMEEYLLARGLGAAPRNAFPDKKLGAASTLIEDLLGADAAPRIVTEDGPLSAGLGGAAGNTIEAILDAGDVQHPREKPAAAPSESVTPAPAPAPTSAPAPAITAEVAPAPVPTPSPDLSPAAAPRQVEPEDVFTNILEDLLNP